mmetsp:Transcript_9188/g.25825  ORF Transcript_9188/g.25825 Transcript_9188/m.25825 type:complete len:130 (+) Transcript_9188:1428-1817(+)
MNFNREEIFQRCELIKKFHGRFNAQPSTLLRQPLLKAAKAYDTERSAGKQADKEARIDADLDAYLNAASKKQKKITTPAPTSSPIHLPSIVTNLGSVSPRQRKRRRSSGDPALTFTLTKKTQGGKTALT